LGNIKRRSPQQDSGPKILSHQSAESTDPLPPTFSLHHMQLNSKYCLTHGDEYQRAQFASKLRELSQMTWTRIKASGRHSLGCEEIPRRQIKAPIPSSLKEDAALLSFRCIGKKPMVGFRDGHTFHILWIDFDWTLYNHSRK
jgi:hypothetical protein